jgi:SAM-dependent methyltransferase
MTTQTDKFQSMAAFGVHDKVLELVTPYLDGKKILVAGSGQGEFEQRLLSQSVDRELISSIDIDPSQFKIDALECGYCDLNTKAPFADKSIDIWLSIEVIEHLHNPQNLIDEAHRVLKDDGWLFITTPNVHSFDQKLRYMLSSEFYWFREKDFDGLGHIHPIFDWLFRRMIRNQFEIVTYDAPRFRFKILSKGPGIPVPFKSKLFADINVYMLRKVS